MALIILKMRVFFVGTKFIALLKPIIPYNKVIKSCAFMSGKVRTDVLWGIIERMFINFFNSVADFMHIF